MCQNETLCLNQGVFYKGDINRSKMLDNFVNIAKYNKIVRNLTNVSYNNLFLQNMELPIQELLKNQEIALSLA